MVVQGGLQIAEKRKDAKSKEEKERQNPLNVEFRRIAQRDKKAFLSDQCKEIRGKQENGKDQRSLQENQRYQENISCKDGLNEGQKWDGPNKSRRCKKDLLDPDNHDGVTTH